MRRSPKRGLGRLLLALDDHNERRASGSAARMLVRHKRIEVGAIESEPELTDARDQGVEHFGRAEFDRGEPGGAHQGGAPATSLRDVEAPLEEIAAAFTP